MLDRKRKAYERRRENLSAYELSGLLPHMKEYAPFLKEVEAKALQQSVLRIEAAYKDWWKAIKRGDDKHGVPRFKSIDNPVQTYNTTRINEKSISSDGKYIKLPKIGYVRCVFSRAVEGHILNACISKKPSGKYYISLCCDIPDTETFSVNDSEIGLVFNTSAFAEDSNGVIYSNPNFLSQSIKKLTLELKRLKRKQYGSDNWKKQKIKVARLYEDIANQRADHHHKLSTDIIRNNQYIFVEDISIAKLVQESKDSNLNRKIYDIGWGEFIRQLEYKAKWYGKTVVKVPVKSTAMTAQEVLEQGKQILTNMQNNRRFNYGT